MAEKNPLLKACVKIEATGKLYGDVSFQKVTWISKRYKYATESAKYYSSGYTVSLGQISPVSLRQVTSLGYKETFIQHNFT